MHKSNTEMLNNNVRRLRDESGLNFVLSTEATSVAVIQAAINGRIRARLGAKWPLKNVSFSCTARIALTLVRREVFSAKAVCSPPQLVAN